MMKIDDELEDREMIGYITDGKSILSKTERT
jgi:hypothetical protein